MVEIDRRAALALSRPSTRVKSATPLPLIFVDPAARASRDSTYAHVTVMDVPTVGAFGIAAAGEGGIPPAAV